jgi:hypothetical protein
MGLILDRRPLQPGSGNRRIDLVPTTSGLCRQTDILSMRECGALNSAAAKRTFMSSSLENTTLNA